MSSGFTRWPFWISVGLAAGFCVLMAACGAPPPEAIRLSTSDEGALVLNRGEVELVLDRNLQLDLRFQGHSIVAEPGEGARPANFITVDGQEISNFQMEPGDPKLDDIDDSHGTGTRVGVTAVASLPGGGQLRQLLGITLYDRYPTLIVFDASYQNLGAARPLSIDRVETAHLRLDAKRSEPGQPSYSFHTFQGGSYEWGRSYAGIPITADFNQKNFMGLYTRAGFESRTDEGGGINLIDVWNKHTGIALCHLATEDLFLSFPTETGADGRVRISVLEEPDADLGHTATLGPEEIYHVQAPIGIIVHSGDFFEPLRIYRDLLIDQGVAIQQESPAWTYQSYWKTWGWQRDFTMQMVYDRIPQLLELNIKQVQIDDGWQDHVGDWNPNAGVYPGGEADVIASIKQMKRLGAERVYLWWNPLGVDPAASMARKTEWLVLGKDGQPASKEQHTLCPAYPPVQERIRGLVRKWISEWGYDGLYNDFAMNSVAPACFNPAHNHARPTDAFAATPEIWRIIWEESHRCHDDPFVETCICALPHSLFKNPYTNMTSASDPLTNRQVRSRIKVEKSTHGPRWAYTDCYIEEGRRDPLPGGSDADFASSVGIGAILNTLYADLTPEQFAQYKKWFAIYYRELLSTGDYLNLYDIAYDKPEAHAIRKDNVMYYGLYAESWDGPVELRGLDEREYRVVDYVQDRELGSIHGPLATLPAKFEHYLLLKCVPK